MTRAGTATPFWWGRSIAPRSPTTSATRSHQGDGSKGEYRRKTLPVKSFKPNLWGLYQVHGNVWEWVEDCWHDSYASAPTDNSAWTSEECRMSCSSRRFLALRSLEILRAAFRGRYDRFSGTTMAASGLPGRSTSAHGWRSSPTRRRLHRSAQDTGYLLSISHPRGRSKAIFFMRFGFSASQPDVLARALVDHARRSDSAGSMETAFGVHYIVEGALRTPDARNPLIRAIWVIKANEAAPRFVTATPIRKGKK